MRPYLISLMLSFVVVLAGCAHAPSMHDDAAAQSDLAAAEAAPEAAAPTEPAATDAAATTEPVPPPAAPVSRAKIEPGTGEFINREAASRQPATAPPGDVVFNFENIPIQTVIKAILGDLLQENYVIAPGVSGNVTFSTSRPINAAQARSVLETLLSWNNLALVFKDGRYTVLPVSQAIPGNLTPRVGPPSAARGYEVRVVPLKFIAATEMEKLLQPYVKQGAIVRSDNARSMLVLAGNAGELSNYLETIEVFDVDWLKGMSVGVYPLERVEAQTVVPELEKIFGEGGPTPLAGMFRFMPIERMNAVLVITPQPNYLQQAERWLARLDRGGSDAGLQLYVYYVKNVKATDLAENLTDVFGGGGSRAGARAGGNAQNAPIGSVVPGVESVEIRSLNNQARDQTTAAAAPAAAAPVPPGGGIAIVESEDIRFTAIEESNALMIRATPSQYDAILAAIKRLDIEPLQVHIEAQVLQVDLSGNLSFGVRWFFENSGPNSALRQRIRGFDTSNESRNNAWISFAGSIDNGGLQWTFLNTTAEALVSTLQGESRVQVLSAPSLVVLNNKEASINVGTQIPVVSTFFNPASGGVVQPGQGQTPGFTGLNQSFVQFRDTGITLNVTPRVNPGGLVYLEIKQEQSTPGASPDATGNVPVDRRIVETEIAVQSGQTVLLAGLIRDTDNQGHSGVPGLMKVPLLGRLFGTSNRDTLRQELLVMIKPTVIENADQARDLTDEYRQRFQGLAPLIKANDAR
jgi:general secretion pathway protein D